MEDKLRKLILILMLLLIIPIASAQISQGQIITQTQLNSINVSNIGFQDLRCVADNGYEIDKKYIYKLFNCLEVNQINETHYLIQRGYFSTSTELEGLINCLTFINPTLCRNRFERDVRTQASQQINLIKRQIVIYQTPQNPHSSTIRSWLLGWRNIFRR